MSYNKIVDILGDSATDLLEHKCNTIDQSMITSPGPDFINDTFVYTNRSPQTIRGLNSIYNNGRLAGTGYVSILPVDQGIEHSGGASFAPNPIYFDPENIVKLAIEGGCNAVASTFGVLASCSRKYAHKIPFIVKINHNELLTHPATFDQIPFGSVDEAWNLGATAVGATIYFGSEESGRQISEIAAAFERAHELGMTTILWCYLRNSGFTKDGKDYSTATDITAQANHIGVTIQADIIKQKLATTNNGYTDIG
ncbi:MAG: class I fructose-bisphosphate aldolase, partial [Flavobacteriales bacterium]|nr:class I fructose-bisphosphate aldolase [Flavobacteriales bacterium]